MKSKKLQYQKFLESFKYAPRPAVNLLIVKFAKLNTKAVLLTKRQKPPFAGHWHLPGSFILKGEAIMDCVKRVADEELGIKVEYIKLAGVFDDINGDPRGHVVDLVYRCEIKKGLSLRSKDSNYSLFKKRILKRLVGFYPFPPRLKVCTYADIPIFRS